MPEEKNVSGNVKIFGFLKGLKFQMPRFNPGVVGIEIGSDWLKIVQKDRAKKVETVYRLKLVKLAQIKDSISAAIEENFRLLRCDKQNVVLYIPRHLVTVRMLEVPSTVPQEINDMIDLQVGKQTPYAKEEIIFSHKTVETSSSGYAKVMLAIIARNIVNERLETLVKAGLNVKRVAISSEGVLNWFRGACPAVMELPGSQAILLVDVDSNYSDFMVIRKGKMAFTRNIFIGANYLIQEGAGWHEKFSGELKRSLERYLGAEKNVEIVKAYLSGSGPHIKGLDAVLGAVSETGVESVSQLRSFHSHDRIEGVQEEDTAFVSVTQLLGVTLDDKESYFDLTPSEQKVQNVIERRARQLTITGILIVAIVTVLSFLSLVNVHTKNAYVAKLKKTISNVAREAEGIDKMRALIDGVSQRLDSRGSVLEILGGIYKVTPEEIYLTDIDIDEKQSVVLRGNGFSMSDVFKYAKTLEESEMFESVKTAYTRVKNDKDAELAEFEISCIYQK